MQMMPRKTPAIGNPRTLPVPEQSKKETMEEGEQGWDEMSTEDVEQFEVQKRKEMKDVC